jgi:hypothetical protein
LWGARSFGDVWLGANETTLTASSAIKVGGKAVPAGTYGVHMIPTANDWTVILSRSTPPGALQHEPRTIFCASPSAAISDNEDGSSTSSRT